MGLKTGIEYSFSTMEKDGRKFICIDCGPVDNNLPTLEQAMKILEANGLKISQ